MTDWFTLAAETTSLTWEGLISGCAALIATALGSLGSWKIWKRISSFFSFLHNYLFCQEPGKEGWLTKLLMTHNEMMKKLGEKVEENDAELDTIQRVTAEIREKTEAIHQHTAETRDTAARSEATLRALLDTATEFAKREMGPDQREELIQSLEESRKLIPRGNGKD